MRTVGRLIVGFGTVALLIGAVAGWAVYEYNVSPAGIALPAILALPGVVIAAIGALLVRTEGRSKKARPERPLREQLIAARDDVSRQISVLEAGPSSIGTAVGDFADNSEVLADLRNTLREIEVELAKSGSSDA